MFEHIIGNEKAKQYLMTTARRGTVGNSFLFAGPDGIGKSLFANEFAKLVICQDDPQGIHNRKIESGNHPDIRIYRPEGKIGMHSIASMRQFSEEVYLAPFEAKWKVFIVHDADRMLPYSANALLKTFEEPSQDSLIILLSSNPSALLPTVLSRCRKIYFQPLTEQEIVEFLKLQSSKSEEEQQLIAYMAQGSIGQAVKLANKEGNPLRGYLLDILKTAKFNTFKELTSAAAHIAESVEVTKKAMETSIRTELLRNLGTDLTSAQKQGIEKEVEGAVMMQAMQEASALFRIILAWYRDLQLIGVNGNAEWLLHRDRQQESSHAYEQGLLQPLDKIQQAINEARLALERSTSLAICFENLFLKLGLLG